MARARGANALAVAVFETGTYGTTPGAGYFRLPFVSHQLGEERGLIPSDLLGQGRNMQDPTYDVANNAGDMTVPVDVRNFGQWLKLMFGAPVTTGAAAAASGILTLTANLADGATVTIGPKVYTFQAALTNADGNVQIGASMAATIVNLKNAINLGTGVPGTDYAAAMVAHATVSATASSGTTLTVAAKIGGPAQNTIATTETSPSASWGAATLTGGATATHVFTSGAQALPSLSLEIGNPDVPSYSTHFGIRANQLKIAMQRSGLLNAVMSLIAQGETTPAGATAMAGPTSMLTQRFAQASCSILRDGAVLGQISTADFTATNNLETVETIRADGRIEDADPAMFGMTGSLNAKFKDLVLYNLAVNGTPVTLSFAWTSGDFSLTFALTRVFLPRVKRPISGPGGIMQQFNWESSGALGAACVATLVSDVVTYA